ncbi:MAG: SUMF1/EgtB/PvdO family nonheme iron enzyme, partial [Myxococcota bacterium]
MKAGVWIVGLAACGAPSVAAPPPPGPPRPVEAPAPEERMTAIPGGVYRLGSEAATPRESDRWVEITAFAIDSYEVTAADYARCVEAGACSQASARADLVSFPPWDAVEERAEEAARRCNVETGRLRHPINCVNYAQATAYCTWRDARLPTAAEWEVAARGARVASRPWGDEAPVAGDANLCAPSCELEGEGDNYIGTSPVGSFARDRTQAGVFDMLGNVGEWTRDFTVPGFGGGTPMWQGGEPVGADDGPQAVVMGADFTARYDSEQTLTRTRALWQSLATAEVGFRCARSTEPSPGDVPREAFRSPEAAGALSPELRRAFER